MRVVGTTVRARLIALVLACVVPVSAFATYLAHGLVSEREQESRDRALERLRLLSVAIDQYVLETQAAVELMATSPALRRGDLADFHQQITEALRYRGIGVVLLDLDGQQLVSTNRPFGDPLPRRTELDTLRRVVETGRPQVSDLVTAVVLKRPILSVEVPVRVEGELRYVLAMGIGPDRLAEAMRRQNLPPEWAVGLVDRTHRIIARSRDSDAFVGRPVAPGAALRDRSQAEGRWIRSVDFEGRPVLSTFVRSALTGWTVYAAIPTALLDTPAWAQALPFAATGAAALLAGCLMAAYVARGITRPLGRFAGLVGAEGAPKGDGPDFSPSGVREIDNMLALLAARERQRDEALARLREGEQRLRATYEQALVGIAETDRAGRFLRVNRAMCELSGYSQEELLGHGVVSIVHDDDREREAAAYRDHVSGARPTYTIEKRYLRKDGRTAWVSVAASSVLDAQGRFLYGVRVVQDVTERREAEERQRLLVAELNHRVKNSLATVRSLARQTMRHAASPEGFGRAFEARLSALAITHDLLTRTSWRGTDLRLLLSRELEPYAPRPAAGDGAAPPGLGPAVAMDGPDVHLTSRATLSLGLAFHELATNAAKYGCLSAEGGRLRVSWSVEERAGLPWLSFDWAETGGPPAAPAPRQGFGTYLIRRLLTHELGGRAEVDHSPAGLRCRIEIPLDPDAAHEDGEGTPELEGAALMMSQRLGN
jgi:PAS domain S-box-containing protein